MNDEQCHFIFEKILEAMVNPLMASMISVDLTNELSQSGRRTGRVRNNTGRSFAFTTDRQSMGLGSNASASEPGSGTGQPLSWAQLKTMILEAIKKNEQQVVFEALLADVSNFMTEIKRTG